MPDHPSAATPLRFNRHELAGAFGDIGTDLPLLVGLVALCGLDATSVCVMFGLLQVATGLVYRLPMPVQPLKAMAAIMLTQRLAPGVLAGGGLAIGATMLLLAATGLLDVLARTVPREVVRGVQLGLGLSLAQLALRDYASSDGVPGYVLAGAALAVLLVASRQRQVPAPLLVLGLGLVYALWTAKGAGTGRPLVGLSLPRLTVPTLDQLVQGALLLALPQLPLSLGNSVIATSQTTRDLFPATTVTVKRLGFTFGLMNLVGPLFGGVPVCHGCGGLVGFYGFGARTGGAPVIYGSLFVAVGLFFSGGFDAFVHGFPLPVLGVVLLVEAVSLMNLVTDPTLDRSRRWIALAVAAAVVGLPYGYLVGLVAGTLLSVGQRRGWLVLPSAGSGP